VIREFQISVVICGWDHQNWVAWGLFNTPIDPTDDFDPDDEQFLKEDYFAADGEDGLIIDADAPMWDPRAYWLHIVEFRVRLVLKEWKWLVRNIEAGVTKWVSVLFHLVVGNQLMIHRKNNIPSQLRGHPRTARRRIWKNCSVGPFRPCNFSGTSNSGSQVRRKHGNDLSHQTVTRITSRT
jgi:hypothetical protein